MKRYIFLLFLAFSFLQANGYMQILQPLTSSCPKSWLDDMKNIADEVEVLVVRSNKAIKRDVGIPKKIQSCNTSFLNDFVFEGNVPAKAIKEFLADVPKGALGLALPASQNDKSSKKVYVFFSDKSFKEFGKY